VRGVPGHVVVDGCYFLLDCPGQVELFTLHNAMQNIIQTLTNEWHIRCAAGTEATV
jgi:hypothetical protein